MDAILEALWFGVRVTLWIFKRIYIGYADTLQWLSARNHGVWLPFPFLNLLVSLLLTVFLVWFWVTTR